MHRLLAVTLFLLAAFVTGHAQTPGHLIYDVEDGLSASEIFHGLQDKDGFMWFATAAGASRFDGHEFMNLTMADGLPDTEVLKLECDSKGRVWFLCSNGKIAVWDHHQLLHAGNNETLAAYRGPRLALCTAETPGGGMLLGSSSVINYLHLDSGICRNNLHQFPMGTGPRGLWINSKDQVWFNNRSVFQSIDNKTTIPSEYDLSHWCRTVRYGDSAAVVVCKAGLLELRGTQQRLIVRFDDPDFYTRVHRMFVSDHSILLATSNGVYKCNRNADGSMDMHQYFPSAPASTFFRDREGGYWITTLGRGVIHIPVLEVSNLYPSQEDSEVITCMGQDKNGAVWIGSTGKLVQYIPSVDNMQSVKIGDRSVGRNRMLQIMPGPDGSLWLIRDLLSTNINGPDTVSFPYVPKRMMPLPDGTFLVTSQAHTSRLTRADMLEPRDAWFGLMNDHQILTARAGAFCLSSTGDAYVGSPRGLHLFSNGTLTAVEFGEALIGKNITNLVVDDQDRVWATTELNGVYGLSPDTVLHFTTKNGLPTNSCSSIAIDAQQRVWVGTRRGIVRFEPDSRNGFHPTTFGRAHGLTSSEVLSVLVRNDTVWALSSKGVSLFPVDLPERTSAAPEVEFSAAWNNGELFDPNVAISFEPGQHNLKFHFIGLTFQNPHSVHYKYRLVGLDAEWLETRQREIHYPSLPSGTYTLEVVAIIASSNIEGPVSTVSFSIAPYFWQSKWFAALVAFLLVAFIYALFRLGMLAFNKAAWHALLERFAPARPAPVAEDRYLFFKIDGQQVRIRERGIFYIQAAGDYAELFTEEKKYLVHSTLKAVAEHLTAEEFARVHRSYIVRIDKIEGLKGKAAVIVQGEEIPVGRTHKANLEAIVEQLKLVK